MKTFRFWLLAVAVALVLYGGAYWLYFKTEVVDLGVLLPHSTALAVERRLERFFYPCIQLDEMREVARNQWEERNRFYGRWEEMSGYESAKMEIHPDGSFSLHAGAQSLAGKGHFEVIDDILYFRCDAHCKLAKDDEGRDAFLTDFTFSEMHDGMCRISAYVDLYTDDEPNFFASYVHLNSADDEERYLASFSFRYVTTP